MKNRTRYKSDAPWQNRWIVLFLLFTVHCSLFLSPAGAQTFTQRIQQSAKGEGTLTIHQSKDIDELVNAPVEKKTEKSTNTKKQEKTADKTTAATTPPPVTAPATEKDTLETATADSHHRTRKMTGYRVQAFAGGNTRADRQKAERTANAIRSLFPGEAVYTHFYNPRWICRVGNYPNYEDARRMLTELRKLGYSSATIVKGKITVPY